MFTSARALRAILRYRFKPSNQPIKLRTVADRVGVSNSQLSEWSWGERLIPRNQIVDLTDSLLRLGYPEPLVRRLFAAWLHETNIPEWWITVNSPLTIRSLARMASS